METIFKRITIIGTGFMGGSLALACKKAFPGVCVAGYVRRRAALKKVKKAACFDEIHTSLGPALQGSDAVILATPISVTISLMPEIASHIDGRTVVFDLGSTKGKIHLAGSRYFPGKTFVGCHPLCGSEKSGIASADGTIFEGALCIITSPRTRRSAQKVKRFWEGIGSRVRWMTPAGHDGMMASLSHLPHVLAFALSVVTPDEYYAWAPQSFRDMTRIAASRSLLWEDIFRSNRENMVKALTRILRELERFRGCIDSGDEKRLVRMIDRSNEKRRLLDGKKRAARKSKGGKGGGLW